MYIYNSSEVFGGYFLASKCSIEKIEIWVEVKWERKRYFY